MTELIRNAWLGWKDYNTEGKLAAVLLAVLILFWFGQKKVEKKAFLLYTTGITISCILPFTAAVLMAYQTRFYDYEWIWSMVPLSAAISWGIVFFLMEFWQDFKPAGWRRGLPLAGLVLALLLLCGGPGSAVRAGKEQKEDRRQAVEILDNVKEMCSGEDICLWAPRKIMEYVRETDAAVRLPYGRDMWDASLGAYSYDTYGGEREAMYRWMEALGGIPDKNTEITPAVLAEYARSAGVNCILIPDTAESETIRELEEALNADAQKLEGYWIFYGWND